MAARKRRQGQSRKANASASAVRGTGCSHGMPKDNSMLIIAHKFTDVHTHFRQAGNSFNRTVAAIKEHIPILLTDESVRNGVRAFFLSFAANIILEGEALTSSTLQVGVESIVILESFGSGKGLSKAEHMTCHDAMSGCERSLLKFHASRLPLMS